MNSHIINPFRVDTQFTLQIHLIIDLITFKEAMVFGSIGMPFSPPLPLLFCHRSWFCKVWVMLGGGGDLSCISLKDLHTITGSLSWEITFQISGCSLGIFGERGKTNTDSTKQMPFTQSTPQGWPWASQPQTSQVSFQSPFVLLQLYTWALQRMDIITSSSTSTNYL